VATLTKPTLLLLDAGNTLVFLDHDALARAAASVGIVVSGRALAAAEPIAKQQYQRALREGLSHEDGWGLYVHTIFANAQVAGDDAWRATDSARVAHAAFNLWRSVPTGLVEHLERALAAGIRLGVVSNSEGQLDALFARVGLAHLFEHVIDSAIEGVRKPDPEIFRRALARFGVRSAEALYAGDIPDVDVGGARAAGMEAVLIDPFDHFPGYTEALRFDSVMSLVDA
jgi:putative hydrolase of the HAD superfamily